MNEYVKKIDDLSDGSTVYEVGESPLEEEFPPSDLPFMHNLSESMSSGELERITNDLLENIKDDRESRSEWEQAYLKGMKYLGYKLEDFKNVPFMTACRAFDTTLSSSLIRFYATARAELFPQKGPVHCQVVGETNTEFDDQSSRVQDWMNYYLTEEDKEYYTDSERLLMYLGLVGCAFRKVYQDPITNRPLARFISPQDFIVNNNCVSLLSSDRLTHVLKLSKKEIRLRQLNGMYRDIPVLGMTEDDFDSETDKTVRQIEGIKKPDQDDKQPSLFNVFEVHVDLALKDDPFYNDESKIPLPYVVTICESERKILSIVRNWKEDDQFSKRIEYFVQYNYLPGFGLYGLGLSQLIGSNVVALTSLLRQLIDAGTLKNFPGGLKVKGLKVENNDKAIGPCEFWDVETGGLPIQQAIMPMPYSEPSMVLKELRDGLIQQTQSLAMSAETQVAEGNQNETAVTTLAKLEVANLVQSSVLRSLHVSLTRELNLLYGYFQEYFMDEPYSFPSQSKNNTISRADFNDFIKIVPSSDSSFSTYIQRLNKAESVLKIAQTAPQLHDLRKIYERVYSAMKVENVQEILPPPQQPQALDPLQENANAIQGKPLKAEMWQDHQAHIVVHMPLSEQNPSLQAHVREHEAMDYLLKMQQAMGIQLPPLEQVQDPNMQNQIALMASHVVQQQQLQQQQEAQQQQPAFDPSQLMMADITQKQEATQEKREESHLKAETEAFKARLKYDSEQNKIQADMEKAEEKNKTDIILQQIKNEEKEDPNYDQY